MDFLNAPEFRIIINIIDVLLVITLLYYVYKLVKGTVAINIFIGIVLIYLIWRGTVLLDMQILSTILGQFISVGIIALIVVFQQEIRKFLLMVGSTNFARKRNFTKHFKFLKKDIFDAQTDIKPIIAACKKMSGTKTGAIIIMERTNSLEFVKNTGDKMYIKVNQPIIESIFFKNSPLHDGAIIIEANHIISTRVALPVSDQKNIPRRFGLRHRAAVGITEKTDAVALVVSEETGQLSYIKDGTFVFFNDEEQLVELLEKDLE